MTYHDLVAGWLAGGIVGCLAHWAGLPDHSAVIAVGCVGALVYWGRSLRRR